jgi:hypothetical protein
MQDPGVRGLFSTKPLLLGLYMAAILLCPHRSFPYVCTPLVTLSRLPQLQEPVRLDQRLL